MTRTRTALAALSLGAGLFAVSACQSTPSSAPAPSSATTAPDSVTCEGKGIDTAAQLHHRTETRINAPLSTVWEVQTDVEGWPAWQKAVTGVKKLDQGELRAGSRFEWTTPAPATAVTPATTLTITSTVLDVKPGACVRWSGPAVGQGLGIDEGVHVWTFTEVDGGVLVRTEESWTGAQLEADPATAIKVLAPGLDFWLADLKAAAEARPTKN